MSSNEVKAVLAITAALVILTGIGITVHNIAWLREHRYSITASLLLLILAGSGSIAATAALLNLTRPDTTEPDTATAAPVAVLTAHSGRPTPLTGHRS